MRVHICENVKGYLLIPVDRWEERQKMFFFLIKESALVSNSVTASCTTENRANIVNVLAESFVFVAFTV